jgi:putative spermidine/putrescine transport system ATP-binding protein
MSQIRLSSKPASLDIENLAKHYGSTRALDGVSFRVREGEFLTLLGPSGSGKTTTLRLVAGFMRPTSGTIRISDTDITFVPPHRRDIGMVFQNYALFPHMTAGQNIAFPLQVRGVKKSGQAELVTAALTMVRMADMTDRYPRQLSGGQQQRIAFARAVVMRPRLLLMDEPFGALDKKLREAIQLEVKQLHRELGVTVVHVTHDQEEALILSDRIAVFSAGKIEQIGSASELYEKPASVFVADFLGESNVFRGQVDLAEGSVWLKADALRLRCRADDGAVWCAGDGAALIVRPERMELQDPDAAIDPAHEGLVGTIRQVIYLGSALKYELDVSGQKVFARMDLKESLVPRKPDDRVAIVWRRDAAILVPAPAEALGQPGTGPALTGRLGE